MPLIPNFVERMLLRSQPQIAPFIEIWEAGAFEALQHAAYLGVFEAIKDGVATSPEIAKRINADERGTTLLLGLLEAFGYLKKDHGRYMLTKVSAAFFENVSLSSQELLWLYKNLYIFWREYEEDAIRTGKPAINIFDWFDQHPEVWKFFHAFEVGIAKVAGRKIVADSRLPPSAKKLIDVGGGHGIYSVLFCRHYPNLYATIFDRGNPLQDARTRIGLEKMGARISIQEGDFLKDDLGTGYDAAFLSNIIHLFPAETNQELLRKVGSSLSRGGKILILDQITGGEFGNLLKAGHAYYSLFFLILTGGQLYSLDEVSQMLSQAGFANVTRKKVRSTGSDLVMATKT